MSEWKEVSIDEIKSNSKNAIAIGPFGSRLKSENYVNEGVPVIRGTNVSSSKVFSGNFVFITKEMAKSLGSANVYPGDLVFPHRGAIGEVGIVDGEGFSHYVLSSSLMKLTPDMEKVIPDYLFYFFKSKIGKNELLKNASTVGTPGIGQPLSSLKSIRLNLPSLLEQKAIAHILGTLDDKIELNRQMNQTLEAMAQALFKSWFVDFDQVMDNALKAGTDIPDELQAMAEKRQLVPDSQKLLNKNPELAAKFPSSFAFNEMLGKWIPEGWEVKNVEDALIVNPSVSIKKGEIKKFADMKALPTSGYSIEGFIEKEYNGGAKFNQGDVLLARITPCLENGKTAIVDFLNDGEKGFGSTEFVVLRGKNGIKTPFVACLARHDLFVNHCIQNMVGSSGRQRVQNSCFNSYYLALPDIEVLSKFHLTTDPFFKKITKNSSEIQTLIELRDRLLPELISGRVRVQNFN